MAWIHQVILAAYLETQPVTIVRHDQFSSKFYNGQKFLPPSTRILFHLYPVLFSWLVQRSWKCLYLVVVSSYVQLWNASKYYVLTECRDDTPYCKLTELLHLCRYPEYQTKCCSSCRLAVARLRFRQWPRARWLIELSSLCALCDVWSPRSEGHM